jgi:hypothetical protein
MTNKTLKETVEKVYADYGLTDRAILIYWTGKETDITIMRIAADLALDSLYCKDISYARAYRDVIHAVSDDSLKNERACSIIGIYF